MAEKRLVVLKTFPTRVEAELYRNRLRAQNIPAELSGPDTSSTFGSYFGPMSHVSVMVTEDSARRLAQSSRGAPEGGSRMQRKTCHSAQPHTPIHLPRAPHIPPAEPS
jgi:hypothetical protein